MKTKLYLALPCLGLVLALVLAACGGDSGTNNMGGPSSDSGAPYAPSSEVKSDSVVIDGFGTELEGDRVSIVGKIFGTPANPIVIVEFSPANWFSSEISLPTPTVTLGGRVYIDLDNPSITTCGKLPISVKACIDMACKTYSTKNSEFDRPQSYCNSSSSGADISSSSEAVWRFGEATPIADIPLNASISIGSGSFRLSGDDGQPSITVTGGTVRATGLSMIGDDTPVPGTPYSSRENVLGSSVPTSSVFGNDNEGVQNKDYLLIYFGSTIYLLRLEAKSGSPWPTAKQGTYWLATEHP
jgi:hypothetical protein